MTKLPNEQPPRANANIVLVTASASSSSSSSSSASVSATATTTTRTGARATADVPTSTPVPPPPPSSRVSEPSNQPHADVATTADGPVDRDPPPPYPKPKLRIEIRDLAHEGADVFLQSVNVAAVLAAAVGNVQRLLYGRNFWDADPATHVPPTRSVTLVLRAMDGVAYTAGSELDSDHKEIHFSLGYIAGIAPRAARAGVEIAGVLTHELVHCYQWSGAGNSAPGGLVEGVADWVRLRCALVPPHWKREPAAVGRWDGGYQHTAYFLDYLEHRAGDGTVRQLNEALRRQRYEEACFWPDLLGRPVAALWADYVKAVEHGFPGVEGKTDIAS
ncbi:NADH-ubiquinone oxidoreductase [Niveomyces insectorum RCEF 264]|uniref:NADH-ubiquinone oxidoreductase n=1 Tax=Niveomyces insectorum RCEF 264 TaxID=1081102 RepID=A0A167PG61_9HYPO|nr:NADH-ubiquinone oxidoreductase [Niveomyces insectorum RCEF 264]